MASLTAKEEVTGPEPDYLPWTDARHGPLCKLPDDSPSSYETDTAVWAFATRKDVERDAHPN